LGFCLAVTTAFFPGFEGGSEGCPRHWYFVVALPALPSAQSIVTLVTACGQKDQLDVLNGEL